MINMAKSKSHTAKSLLTSEQKAELVSRARLFRKGRLKLFSWEEVKQKARSFTHSRSGL